MELGAKINTPVTFVRAFCHSTGNKLGQEWESGPRQRLLAKAGFYWCDDARQLCGGKGFFGLCTPVTVHRGKPRQEFKAGARRLDLKQKP